MQEHGWVWMASPTWWTWVWASSGSWWRTRKLGVLQSMGLQRVRHNWVTELNWIDLNSCDKYFSINQNISSWQLLWDEMKCYVRPLFSITSSLTVQTESIWSFEMCFSYDLLHLTHSEYTAQVSCWQAQGLPRGWGYGGEGSFSVGFQPITPWDKAWNETLFSIPDLLRTAYTAQILICLEKPLFSGRF